MVCLGNVCMDTLHKGDNDAIIIIIIIIKDKVKLHLSTGYDGPEGK